MNYKIFEIFIGKALPIQKTAVYLHPLLKATLAQ